MPANGRRDLIRRLKVKHIHNYPSYAFQTYDKDAPRRSQNNSN